MMQVCLRVLSGGGSGPHYPDFAPVVLLSCSALEDVPPQNTEGQSVFVKSHQIHTAWNFIPLCNVLLVFSHLLVV